MRSLQKILYMNFDIITIFPDIIHSYASESILGRAQKKELIKIRTHNLRDFSGNKWGHVDDKPYGGGPGMILQVEPIYKCLKQIVGNAYMRSLHGAKNKLQKKTRVILMDPAGKKFDQRMAEKFSKLDNLVIISGRYEGFDARVYKFVDERVSVGDYVLAGGELPALVITEAVARLLPGVLGNEESLLNETFAKGVGSKEYGVKNNKNHNYSLLSTPYSLKEYPQYTRPENFMGLKVPNVLLSGNHRLVEKWRKEESK
ncbi:MAG: tRNA (guanosine(37)-N1)-methyltransferase TrmD [Candidatus Magasanikbacteria bacterium]|nr:tRNA (guanosine(37)-N1)-methyltransferase TrmD [Candidatus Magasanikbacteria bacterium]